jgi:transposase
VLATDETILRLFPPLRAAWAKQGQQAEVTISGLNAKRVLFGAINIFSGHRIVLVKTKSSIDNFIELLELLRRRYRSGRIYLLLDRASWHQHPRVKQSAALLDIELLWLPRQSPKLNPMDQLWRELKQKIAANRQYDDIDQLAAFAVTWLLALTRRSALRKAAMTSRSFWLNHL